MLGILEIGLIVAAMFVVIICCLSLLILRRFIKRPALPRSRLMGTKNIPVNGTNQTSNILQLRNLDPCAADAHERQQLVNDDTTIHYIEPTANVDAKVAKIFSVLLH